MPKSKVQNHAHLLFLYQRNYSLWFVSSKNSQPTILPSSVRMCTAAYRLKRTKPFAVQVDFISWLGTFPHKIFSKETSDWKKNEIGRHSPLFLVTFVFFRSSLSFFPFS
jgi:hypothetical protein